MGLVKSFFRKPLNFLRGGKPKGPSRAALEAQELQNTLLKKQLEKIKEQEEVQKKEIASANSKRRKLNLRQRTAARNAIGRRSGNSLFNPQSNNPYLGVDEVDETDAKITKKRLKKRLGGRG